MPLPAQGQTAIHLLRIFFIIKKHFFIVKFQLKTFYKYTLSCPKTFIVKPNSKV